MIILGLDTETTGVDCNVDRIIELAFVVWDTTRRAPMTMWTSIVAPSEYDISTLPPIITEITGIRPEDIRTYGVSTKLALLAYLNAIECYKPEFLMGYNGRAFDKLILGKEITRTGGTEPNLPWLDPMEDLPTPLIDKRLKLKYLAAEHDFVNPFSHRALFDVLTMLKVCDHYEYDGIVAESRVPMIVVRAMINYDDLEGRSIAKQKGFRFNELDGRKYPKMWVRKIKENKLDALRGSVPFKVARLE